MGLTVADRTIGKTSNETKKLSQNSEARRQRSFDKLKMNGG